MRVGHGGYAGKSGRTVAARMAPRFRERLTGGLRNASPSLGGIVGRFFAELWTTGDGQALLTGVVNEALAAGEIPFAFTNVLDRSTLKEQADGLLVATINARIGTNFATILNVSRDDLLAELGKLAAVHINEATGLSLLTIWPPDEVLNAITEKIVEEIIGDE